MFSPFIHFVFIFAIALWPMQKDRAEVPLKKTQLELPASLGDFQWVRVSIARDVAEVTVRTDQPYSIVNISGEVLSEGDQMTLSTVKAVSSGISLGGQIFQDSPLTLQSEGDGIQIGDRTYRHAIEISRDSPEKISIVNEVSMEDYLRGVLPWEANPKWGIEALKAQAVTSRTYALFRSIERKKEMFAVSKGIMSQVYKGKTIENPVMDKAIQLTEGEILTYKGKIFPAFFHSTCGGRTTRADYIWDVEFHPVLKGVTCEFCQGSKHYRWQGKFTLAEIEETLNQKGMPLAEIEEIEIVDVDSSGRTRAFEIKHRDGTSKIQSNQFRLWMDPDRFKSTKILYMKRSGDSYFIRGHGWGHGVGLCQYGMKRLAELGYNYRQILEYYYPGSEIRKVSA